MTDQSDSEHPAQQQDSGTGDDHHGPGVRLPPPLVFLSFLILGWFLQRRWPLGIGDAAVIRFLGVVLFVSALVSLIGMGLMFRKHQTSIKPWEPTAKVMDHGLYAYSRNPIYVAFCLLVIGIGMSLNSLWMSLSFLPAVLVVFRTAIVREERYLEEKFGDQYRRYCERVRRWL